MTTIQKTKVHTYGLRAPIEGAELVTEQMFLARRYQNELVALERDRRAKLRELLESRRPDVELWDARVEAKVAEIKAVEDACREARVQSRSKKDPAGLKSKKALLRRELKQIYRDRKTADRAALGADPEFRQMRDELRDASRAEQKRLRGVYSERGLFWGTYLKIEASAEQARDLGRCPLFRGGRPNDPKFKRWDGTGLIAAQIQKGISGEALVSCDDRRARIEILDGDRKRPRGVLWLRIGSKGPRNLEPIWAKWPIIMHRPLPDDCQVMWVSVTAKKRGTTTKWEAHVTFRYEQEQRAKSDSAVAFDLGWRSMNHEVRAGYLVGTDGSEVDARCSADVVRSLNYSRDVRSISDKKFEAMCEHFGRWLKDREVPGWLREETKHMARWRNHVRLVRVIRRWRDERFDGDESMFNTLDEWRKNDRHLYDIWNPVHQRAILRRREGYRVLAAEMARKFDVLVIEKVNLSKLAKKSVVGDKRETGVAGGNRTIAAPSELRGALVNAFEGRGKSVVEVPAAYTSKRCHVCGELAVGGKDSDLERTCPNGHTWDRDSNAGRNLLELWRERSGDAEKPAAARSDEDSMPSGGRWQRRKREKEERLALEDRSKSAEESAA